MKLFFSRLIRGCGYLPTCGSHPGTGILIILILCGGLAGADKGICGVFFGAGLMTLCFGPIYLYGAYDRAKYEEKE